jgi:1,4-dihydroxy-2-naphthoate octaprenyltransferase
LIAVSCYVQSRALDPRIVWLGLPSSTLIATILSVNNACDIEGDARAGRRTLAIVLGRDNAAR